MAILNVTEKNFESEVVLSSKTVLLDFWASWCGPCKMISPIIEQIADEYTDILVGKVNVDEVPALAQEFQVMSIPTLIVMQNGKVINKMIGYRTKDEIVEML